MFSSRNLSSNFYPLGRNFRFRDPLPIFYPLGRNFRSRDPFPIFYPLGRNLPVCIRGLPGDDLPANSGNFIPISTHAKKSEVLTSNASMNNLSTEAACWGLCHPIPRSHILSFSVQICPSINPTNWNLQC